MDNIFEKVQRNIDKLAAANVSWSSPVTHAQITSFSKGNREGINMFLPPAEWLSCIKGKKILCLAGAGGQQGPLFAAVGADVVVFDLSENMLEKDRQVAQREGLTLRIVQGNMCDLSVFDDEAFDIIVNPPSLMYVPDVLPAFGKLYCEE